MDQDVNIPRVPIRKFNKKAISYLNKAPLIIVKGRKPAYIVLNYEQQLFESTQKETEKPSLRQRIKNLFNIKIF